MRNMWPKRPEQLQGIESHYCKYLFFSIDSIELDSQNFFWNMLILLIIPSNVKDRNKKKLSF
jgi:hypothetical protein